MTVRDQLRALYRRTSLPGWYTSLKLWLLPLEVCARLLPEGRILDVGCGYGFLANYLSLAGPARHVVGHDVDAERIRIARQTIGDRRNIEFVVGDSRELRMSGFDGAVAADTLHHVPYEQQAPILRDLYEKLKPGGVLVIRETDKKCRLRYFLFHCFLETVLYLGKERARFRPAGEWTGLLQSLGYEVREAIPNAPLSPYLTAIFVCVKPG